MEQLRVELVSLQEAFNQHSRETEERMETSLQDAIALSNLIKARSNVLNGEMALVKRATINVEGTSEEALFKRSRFQNWNRSKAQGMPKS